MYPILFNIGNLTVYTHGFLVLFGVIAGTLVIYYLSRQRQLKVKNFLDLILFVVIFGLIGARLIYAILYYNEFNNFWDVFAVWQGGLVSWGGIIFGFLTAYIWLKREKQPIRPWFDIGMIGLLAGWVFGRVGCFLAGDVLGRVSDLPWAINIPMLGFARRHPVALYESMWALIFFMVIFFLYQRKKLADGMFFWLGLGLYSIGRFLIDFTRVEQYLFWKIDFAQIFSFTVLLVSIIMLIKLSGRFNGSKIFRRTEKGIADKKN